MMLGLQLGWIRGSEIPLTVLEECSYLYSHHYGTWSLHSPRRPGDRIRLPPTRLRDFLAAEDSWAALAYLNGSLIAYAFAVRGEIEPAKKITWVTQLVVHEDYRN